MLHRADSIAQTFSFSCINKIFDNLSILYPVVKVRGAGLTTDEERVGIVLFSDKGLNMGAKSAKFLRLRERLRERSLYSMH